MENLHLIVGLGNPGGEYAGTRHNAGFLVLETLGKRWDARWNFERKFDALLARVQRGERQVLLCEPQTYMNLSGEAAGAVVRFYNVSLSRVLVVSDDADLPLGRIRLRPSGSSGGHHGLDSIEQHLATREYARLRVGIGRRDAGRQIIGHVLGRFDSTETALFDKVLKIAADQVECWLEAGIQKAMNLYNGAVDGPENERKEQ
ncbi:MAG TPA: aminoacyl-tRNA hydrolase [Verrucomicrobiae bacterium]|nr:aminoacyl-tRNA hydrolase [Verrucomicrobiae bacterium]